jgi:aminoglycoside phosphotransferase (APT) family kinase protein
MASVNDRLTISSALVRHLINTQFPEWAGLPTEQVQISGWDNTTFRLGSHLKVRLPTAARYVAQVEKEHRWLSYLGTFLPVQIPSPIAIGAPSETYPFPWSVYSWIEGDPASAANVTDLNKFAAEAAQFLLALQRIPADQGPRPGPHSFFRGGSLRVYDSETRDLLQRLHGKLDTQAALSAWETALSTQHKVPDVWVHGDFAPNNLLVVGGNLSAVIDFGCCAVGDPACDLVIAWTFFECRSRETFRSAIAANKDMWARARGWALWKALLQVSRPTGREDEGVCKNPRLIIDDILAEHQSE